MVDSVTNKYECLVVSHKKRLLSFAFVELTILFYLSFRKNYNNSFLLYCNFWIIIILSKRKIKKNYNNLEIAI